MILPSQYMREELPLGWVWALLRDVTIRPTTVEPRKSARARYRYIDISAIDNSSATITRARELRGIDAPTRARQLVRGGDTLYSTVRVYLKNVARVPIDLDGAVASTGFCVLRPNDRIDSGFLFYWVQTAAFTAMAAAMQRGISYPAVNESELLTIAVPLPPRNEQSRIVAAIEELFSKHHAGTGRLDLVHRRASVLMRQIIRSAVPLPGPSSWTSATVQDAGTVSLGRQRAPRYHTGSRMRSYLRVANVFEDRIDTRDVMQMHFEDDEFERYRLVPGDVLLNEGQSPELLGRPALYRGAPENVAFTNSLLRFQPNPGVSPDWALLVFRRHLHSGRFRQESRITTNIAHLSAGRFKTVEFPIPPFVEQQRIVTETTAQLAGVETLKNGIGKTQKRASQLRSAVLTAAFTGKLLLGAQESQPMYVAVQQLAGVVD
jgi:type I restriction enzyme S subunit